jgi:hypothetical protein
VGSALDSLLFPNFILCSDLIRLYFLRVISKQTIPKFIPAILTSPENLSPVSNSLSMNAHLAILRHHTKALRLAVPYTDLLLLRVPRKSFKLGIGESNRFSPPHTNTFI